MREFSYIVFMFLLIISGILASSEPKEKKIESDFDLPNKLFNVKLEDESYIFVWSKTESIISNKNEDENDSNVLTSVVPSPDHRVVTSTEFKEKQDQINYLEKIDKQLILIIIQYLECMEAVSMTYLNKNIGLFVHKKLNPDESKKHKGVELHYTSKIVLRPPKNPQKPLQQPQKLPKQPPNPPEIITTNKMFRWFGTYPSVQIDSDCHEFFYEGDKGIKPNTRTILPHTHWIAVYLQFLTEGKPCNVSSLIEWQKAGEKILDTEKVKVAVDYTYIIDFYEKCIYFGNRGEPRGVKRHLAEGLYIRFKFPALPDFLSIYQFTDLDTAEVYTMDLREYRLRLKFGFDDPDALTFSPISSKSSHPKYTYWSDGSWEFAYKNREKKVKKMHSTDPNVKVSTLPLTSSTNVQNQKRKRKKTKQASENL